MGGGGGSASESQRGGGPSMAFVGHCGFRHLPLSATSYVTCSRTCAS